MLPEQEMWDALRPLLKGLDPVRVENPLVGAGTPDVNIVTGWIELKYAKDWPLRGGPLRVKHFTPQQRGWLERRYKAGGRAWLLLKVGDNEWLLFLGWVAARSLGFEPKEVLYKLCVARWTRKPTSGEIQLWL
jgi:hypothetical protein